MPRWNLRAFCLSIYIHCSIINVACMSFKWTFAKIKKINPKEFFKYWQNVFFIILVDWKLYIAVAFVMWYIFVRRYADGRNTEGFIRRYWCRRIYRRIFCFIRPINISEINIAVISFYQRYINGSSEIDNSVFIDINLSNFSIKNACALQIFTVIINSFFAQFFKAAYSPNSLPLIFTIFLTVSRTENFIAGKGSPLAMSISLVQLLNLKTALPFSSTMERAIFPKASYILFFCSRVKPCFDV